MKLNVQVVVKDFDDKAMQRALETDKKGKILKSEPWTLGAVMIDCLMQNLDSDKDLSGEEKLHNGLLARKIHKAGKKNKDGLLNVKPEDLKIVKERIAKCFNPAVIVATYEMLDGDVDTLKPEQRKKKKKRGKVTADAVEPSTEDSDDAEPDTEEAKIES